MKRFAPLVLIPLLTLLIASAAGEGWLRHTCAYCTWNERNRNLYVSPYEPTYYSWYHLRTPNQSESYPTSDFDIELTTNSLGVRDIEHPLPKAPGEIRIIGLGDSFTEGQGAEFEDGYLKVVERRLSELCGEPVRMIIGGVSGSDPWYSYTLLRDKLMPFQPDIVMLAINNSDVYDIGVRGGRERFLPDGGVRYRDPPAAERLFRYSHLFRFVTMRILGYDWYGVSPTMRSMTQSQAVEDLKAAVLAFRELAEQHGFRFLIVAHPTMHEIQNREYGLGFKPFLSWLATQDSPWVDIMPRMLDSVDRAQISDYFWEHDFHNTARGYRLLGDEVIRGLIETGMVNPSATTGSRCGLAAATAAP